METDIYFTFPVSSYILFQLLPPDGIPGIIFNFHRRLSVETAFVCEISP